MTRALPRTAALVPATAPYHWVAAESDTYPIPVVEPPTCPLPVTGPAAVNPAVTGAAVIGAAVTAAVVGPDHVQYTRQAAVLGGLVGLVLLIALLVALGAL